MFGGAFSSMSYNNDHIADMGGRRALGMNGSLTKYINTGNPAVKRAQPADSFVLSDARQGENKKHKAGKIVAGLAVAAAGVAGVVAGIKTGAFKNIGKLFSKNGSEAAEGASSFRERFAQWSTDLKIKRIEKKADKKIAKLDLKAHKKELAEKVHEAKKNAAKKVKQHKKS